MFPKVRPKHESFSLICAKRSLESGTDNMAVNAFSNTLQLFGPQSLHIHTVYVAKPKIPSQEKTPREPLQEKLGLLTPLVTDTQGLPELWPTQIVRWHCCLRGFQASHDIVSLMAITWTRLVDKCLSFLLSTYIFKCFSMYSSLC